MSCAKDSDETNQSLLDDKLILTQPTAEACVTVYTY